MNVEKLTPAIRSFQLRITMYVVYDYSVDCLFAHDSLKTISIIVRS